MTTGCTASLVREAAAWLEDSRLDVAASVAYKAIAEETRAAGNPPVDIAVSGGQTREEDNQLKGLGALAAAMHFLATVWSAEGGIASCGLVAKRLVHPRNVPGVPATPNSFKLRHFRESKI